MMYIFGIWERRGQGAIIDASRMGAYFANTSMAGSPSSGRHSKSQLSLNMVIADLSSCLRSQVLRNTCTGGSPVSGRLNNSQLSPNVAIADLKLSPSKSSRGRTELRLGGLRGHAPCAGIRRLAQTATERLNNRNYTE